VRRTPQWDVVLSSSIPILTICPSSNSEITATYELSECGKHGKPIHTFSLDQQSLESMISAFHVTSFLTMLPARAIMDVQLIMPTILNEPQNAEKYVKNSLPFRFLSKVGVPRLSNFIETVESALKSLGLYNEKTTPSNLDTVLAQAPTACDGRHSEVVVDETMNVAICRAAADSIKYRDPRNN